MDVKVSCVTSEEVAEKFRVAMNEIQDMFENDASRDYGGGVDRLALVAVSFSDDANENEEYRKQFTKVGRYKSSTGSGYVRYLSVSCAIQPRVAVVLSIAQLIMKVLENFLEELYVKTLKTPIGFDVEKLQLDFEKLIKVSGSRFTS